MEQLSISSFTLNGHDYHLYVYDDLKYLPAGTVVMDASEILPPSSIFQYKSRPSYAGFANFFRYKIRTPNQQNMRRFQGHQQGEAKLDEAVFTSAAFEISARPPCGPQSSIYSRPAAG
jgi:hypothetical protein